MKNAENWARKFVNFSEDYQLEIAELIIDELGFNEQLGFGSYDNEASANTRKVFEKLKEYLEHEIDASIADRLFARISALSEVNKEALSKGILALLEEYFEKQEQDDKEETCAREGHDFSPWKHEEWTSYERVCIDHQIIDDYPMKREHWVRKCRRCGLNEDVKKEPEEVREVRIKEAREKERQALRKRLKELED